ncbi:MAG: polysaccharide biosynthesis protein [Alistipes sp.]|nr:polysaccharide biosynthesis protein [Alistipes sp.]
MPNFTDLIKKYAFEQYVHSGVIAIIDILISLIASMCTIVCIDAVMQDISIPLRTVIIVAFYTIVATIIGVLTMRTHRIIIRHSTISDIWKLVVATIIKEVLLGICAITVLGYTNTILPIILLFDALLTFSIFIITRIAMVIVYDTIKQSFVSTDLRRNIFIYGSSEKSTALKLRLDNSPHYKVVGFIQYGASSAKLAGINLYHFKNKSDEQLEVLFANRNVNYILFPNYDSLREESEKLIPFCTSHNIKILVAPPIDEAVDGNIPQSAIREVKIEDLLGRDEIKISMNEIIENFSGKTILVTGAAGSIGSELCRQLVTFGIDKLIMFDNAETPMHNIRLELEDKYKSLQIIPIIGDVRQPNRLEYVFSKYKPQVVFHAAAYKHVPLMEENPCEAVLVNVYGSRNVADMCIKHSAEMMVMISTDKAVNPTNIMGCTKRLAEIYVQSLGTAIAEGRVDGKTKFVTTRFGNVLGSNGSVIPRFREQIIAGGPVTVTHPDITRFFMTIPEACRLVMEAATMSGGNQIFVFDMGESVKVVKLAERMIELAGFKVGRDIEIKFTGLRPGEKLYEEVLSNTENTIETNHSKIRIAKVREYDYNDAVEGVDKLRELAYAVQIIDMVKLMKQIVPEFKSQNSDFAKLD